MFTKKDIIDIAIKIEKNGAAVYWQASKKIENPDLATFLKWAAAEEERHALFFASLKDEIHYADTDGKVEQLGKALIEDAIGEHSFSLSADDLANVKCLGQLIEKSVRLEEDTVTFYELLLDLIDGESAKTQLERVIAEEKTHIVRLREFMSIYPMKAV